MFVLLGVCYESKLVNDFSLKNLNFIGIIIIAVLTVFYFYCRHYITRCGDSSLELGWQSRGSGGQKSPVGRS